MSELFNQKEFSLYLEELRKKLAEDIDNISQEDIEQQDIVKNSSLPLASIPLYLNAEKSLRKHGNPLNFTSEDVINTFKLQLESGVSAPGIHPLTMTKNGCDM